MIPRAFDRPAPAPKPEPTPIEYDEIDTTVVEIFFAGGDKVVFTLIDGDTYEFAGEAIMIVYKDCERLGRFAESFMIFRTQILYMSERKTLMKVPREMYRPGQVVPDVDGLLAS